MTERIRFHLGENVSAIVSIALRRYGIDVTTTVGAGLRAADDGTQLAFAKRENRVIVTHDDGFLRIASRTKDHPGIVYCHLEARTPGENIRGLRLVYEVLLLQEIEGRVEFL